MSNIVPFPSAGAAALRASGHLGSRLLKEPPPHAHAVQFYDDEPFLLETVAFFVNAGLALGEPALIVATPEHIDGILARLGRDDRDRALVRGQLLLVDADALLARFMRAGEPVPSLFEAALEHLFESLHRSGEPSGDATTTGRPSRRVRAFGEMVDLLWKRGNPAAALRLEEFWNSVCARHDLVLLCGYGMRNFYKADDTAPFGEVCRLHTHVMPTEQFAKDGGDVFDRLREISVLEQRARRLDGEVAYREALEGALRATLDERTRAVLRTLSGDPCAVPPSPTAPRPPALPSLLSQFVDAGARGVARRLAQRLWRR